MSVVAHDEAQSLKERIFAAAITVFAEHGLSGARMEQIATEAQTTKRMVVYYFKTKEQLYQAVLQHVYEVAKKLGPAETAKPHRPVDSGRYSAARPAAGSVSGGAGSARCASIDQQL